MKRENPEDNLQIAVMTYIRLQYPNVLAIHIANERNCSLARGSLLKKMGVKAGMPDILIFERKITPTINEDINIMSPGLALELKIKPNKLSNSQNECLKRLYQEGWKTAVCYSFDEAKNVIDSYLK